jgi:hypothetical protein
MAKNGHDYERTKSVRLVVRLFALLFVVPATYYFVYWVPFSLLQLEGARWVANVVSILCAALTGWFVWRAVGSDRHDAVSSIVLGALLLGGIGFSAGFFGPIAFAPEANQGPLLGIFITGPIGFVLGGLVGLIYWAVRHQQPHEP